MAVGAGIDILRERSVVIDYTSLDFDSLLEDLISYAQTRFSDRWTNFNQSEFAVVWTHLLAYIGDLLAYGMNMGLQERDPLTCVRRQNFINTARAYDFRLSGRVASSVDIELVSDANQLPYVLSATGLKVSDSVGTAVFMPSSTTLITQTPQTVAFVNGDLQSNQLVGVSDGTPDQRFLLLSSPLLESTLSASVNGVPWTLAENAAAMDSTSEMYLLEVDENDNAFIIFGDGVNGLIPAAGQEVRATYKTGGGRETNLPARSINTVVSGAPGALISLTNPAKADFGDDRQSLQSGKSALPASLNAQRRAVVAEDYASILFDTRLTSPVVPGGIAKAGAAKGAGREIYVWIVPPGGGLITSTKRNEVMQFFQSYKMIGHVPRILDAVRIPIRIRIGAYVSRNFRPDDVISRVRGLFATEGTNLTTQLGILDLDNVGLGGRDDEGEPQLTVTRVQDLLAELRDSGLQRAVIEEFTTVPQTKTPRLRANAGDATISDVTMTARLVDRREWVIRWTSATTFDVYQRIVGTSTFLTESQLVDDRLDLDELVDITLPLPSGTVLNPNRNQSLTFAVDTANSAGDVVTKSSSSPGSLFGVANTGDEYYLEFVDSLGNHAVGWNVPSTAAPVSYTSVLSGVAFTVNPGTTPHTAGDELLFDVFPQVGDIVLREDELPVLTRDDSGVAVDLVIVQRTGS